MAHDRHPIHVSREGLRRIAGLRLSGAPLATFIALLASLDSRGQAQITQLELCKLLGTGPGRVWQSLQALVEAGVIKPPLRGKGSGRKTPYRITTGVAVAPDVPRRRPLA